MPAYGKVKIWSMRKMMREMAADFAAKSVPTMPVKVRHGLVTSKLHDSVPSSRLLCL